MFRETLPSSPSCCSRCGDGSARCSSSVDRRIATPGPGRCPRGAGRWWRTGLRAGRARSDRPGRRRRVMSSRVEPSMQESVDQCSVGVADRAQRGGLLRGGGVFGEQQVQAVEVFAPVLVPDGLVDGSPQFVEPAVQIDQARQVPPGDDGVLAAQAPQKRGGAGLAGFVGERAVEEVWCRRRSRCPCRRAGWLWPSRGRRTVRSVHWRCRRA